MNKEYKSGNVKPLHVALSVCIIGVAALSIALSGSISKLKSNADKSVQGIAEIPEATYETALPVESGAPKEDANQNAALVYPTVSPEVKELDDSLILANYAVLVDLSTNQIIAERNPDTKLYPASMSKIMTMIVALEHLSDPSITFTMTSDILDPLKVEGASLAGFSDGEEVTVKDLLYGCGLSSGAEATTALAILVSGSENDFVALMNQKAQELGLVNTHFNNCTGLQDENHYTTATDLAMMMEYAMQNEQLKTILSTYQYTTSSTDQHPDGIQLESTTFEKMYGNEVEGMTIVAGKTGFTDEAGYCLLSYAEDGEGKGYVCVAAKSQGRKGAVYDTLNIYGTIDGGYYSPTTTEPPTEPPTQAPATQQQAAEDNAGDAGDADNAENVQQPEQTEAPAQPETQAPAQEEQGGEAAPAENDGEQANNQKKDINSPVESAA